MTDEKYKHFRNFMVNELGVTRADIETWTKEAVADQVSRLVGQINIEGMAQRAVYSQVEKIVRGSAYGQPSQVVIAALAKVLSERLTVSIKDTQP